MIVKNEEAQLENFLNHLKPHVTEVILVDTGSSDRTQEIARAHGAKVFSFAWEDDFSKARNFSLEKATQPWILILDPDERIAEKDWTHMLDLVSTTLKTSFYMDTRNYTENLMLNGFTACLGNYGDYEKNYPGYFVSRKVRLFRSGLGIHFQGRVHELVEPSIRGPIGVCEIPVHHYGSASQMLTQKNKRRFYVEMAAKKAQDHPQDWKAYYEWGLTLLEQNQHLEAAAAFEKARHLNPTYVDLLINLSHAYLDAHEYELCESVIQEVLKLEPQNHGALFNYAVLEVRRQRLSEAVRKLIELLRLHPQSFGAYRILGLCFMAAEEKEAAKRCFEEAVRLCPRFHDAQIDLSMIYLELGRIQDAKQTLKSVIERDPHQTRAQELMAQVSALEPENSL